MEKGEGGGERSFVNERYLQVKIPVLLCHGSNPKYLNLGGWMLSCVCIHFRVCQFKMRWFLEISPPIFLGGLVQLPPYTSGSKHRIACIGVLWKGYTMYKHQLPISACEF